MTKIRFPAVAGQFYPGDSGKLMKAVDAYIGGIRVGAENPPKAVVAPHAGYVYSGPIAGSAYKHLSAADGKVRRVILLGPAHWAPTRGLAASSASAFATPLGDVPVDQDAVLEIESLEQVEIYDQAHTREHSLEVQLPFLQRIFS
ncbi:MAG: AmmeMemoRadiSam system protein B, partial [Candidatus Promineifilaceae bacterium]